jgi:hypothetical protein
LRVSGSECKTFSGKTRIDSEYEMGHRTQGVNKMSEPFEVNENPTPSSKGSGLKCCSWDQVVKACKSVWRQTLVIGHKTETVVQLPLVVAIMLAFAAPHVAAVILVLGIVFGYSFKVINR